MEWPSVRARLRPRFAAGIVLVLAACGTAEVATSDPAAVPTGSFEPQGEEPIGDVIELGSGQALDIGWRYAIYPSADGWCRQLETAPLTSTQCGDPIPEDDAAFGGVSVSRLPGGITTVDGMVTSQAATVWLIGEGNGRAPAVLMSAEAAGLEALAFVGFAPADVVLTHLQAVAANGDVLDTYELP